MANIELLAQRHADLLSTVGFSDDKDRFGVKLLPHPKNPKVKLVASLRVEGRLDLFTEFGSSPLNMPGDPLNVCIGIPDHDKSFVEAITKTTVAHFLSLEP